jgi:Na+/melibiose symporter-like transporter
VPFASANASRADLTFCDSECGVANSRNGYMVSSIFFGAWFCITCWICCYFIQERSQLKTIIDDEDAQDRPDEDRPPEDAMASLVVNLLNTMNNKPFTSLLPAWCFDTFGSAIYMALATFYIEVVVQPEKVEIPTLYVVGGSIFVMIFGCACSLPVWVKLASSLGKRPTWLLWSAWQGISNVLFLFGAAPTSVWARLYYFMFCAFMNGTGFGAKFLSDTILADIIVSPMLPLPPRLCLLSSSFTFFFPVTAFTACPLTKLKRQQRQLQDYDEFLTGRRSEGTFIMFKSFLPKMISIPASVLPVAFLPSVGYTAPPPGTIVDQPASVTFYLCFMIGGVSTFICVLSALAKLRFPLKTAAQCDAIAIGVGLHNVNKAAPDPLSNEEVLFDLLKLDHKKEADQANLLDFFRGLQITHEMLGTTEAQKGRALTEEEVGDIKDDEDFETRKKVVAHKLRKGYTVELVLTIIFTAVMAALVVVTVQAGFLNSATFTQDYSWVPTLLMYVDIPLL